MEVFFSKCCGAPVISDNSDLKHPPCKTCRSQEDHYYICSKCGHHCCVSKKKGSY